MKNILKSILFAGLLLNLTACGSKNEGKKNSSAQVSNVDPDAPECLPSLQNELSVFIRNWDGLNKIAENRNAVGSFKLLYALKKQCDRIGKNFDDSLFDCNMKFDGQLETVTYEGVEDKCSSVYRSIETLTNKKR